MIIERSPKSNHFRTAILLELSLTGLAGLPLIFTRAPQFSDYANNLLLLGFIVMILGLIRGIGWHTQRSCMEVNMFTSGVHHFKDVAKPRYVRGDVKIGTIVFLLGLFNLLLGGLLLMP